MKAIMQRDYGDAGVLRVENVPEPDAHDGWVSVKLRAAALNWHDVMVREGKFCSPLPHTPGAEGAGLNLSTGEEVIVLPSLWWGREESAPGPQWEILGDHRPGTYAEQVVVPAECLAPKPATLSWEQAAALPVVGVTAYRALISRGNLQPGETVLVTGAGGGLSPMSVSIASSIGARVYVTSSSQDKIERACHLGALGGTRYDGEHAGSWPEAARTLTGGDGFDLVIDSSGSWSDCLRTLRRGGRLVALGARRGELAELDIRNLLFGQYSLIGTALGSPSDTSKLLQAVTEGRIRPPVIDRVFPLERAAQAHAYLQAGKAFGKVVLSI